MLRQTEKAKNNMDKKDFEHMEFSPFAPFGDTPIYKHYPRLDKIRAFSYIPPEYEELGWKEKNLSKLLGFVILFIDTQSPFFEIRDYAQRKADAIKAMKISDKGELNEIEEEGEMFQNLIFEYFRLINNHTYEQWFTYKSQIHTFNAYLRKPLQATADKMSTEVNARRALLKQIKEFTEELQSLEAVLYNDERIAKMINEKTVQNSVGGYAERFAQEPSWH